MVLEMTKVHRILDKHVLGCILSITVLQVIKGSNHPLTDEKPTKIKWLFPSHRDKTVLNYNISNQSDFTRPKKIILT